MKFDELQLVDELKQNLHNANYFDCTPVQEEVLKATLFDSSQNENSLQSDNIGTLGTGADLYVQSQTGTGKTAAYLLCIIQHLTTPALKGKKALVIVPTRELAVQVEEEAKMLCKNLPIKVASFYGGVGYSRQESLLKKGVDILVATPGRLIDLHKSGAMDLSAVAFLVVDEADRMFDMGFYPDLRTLIKFLPSENERHTMLFSATLNSFVKNLAWEYTSNAKEITIDCDNITVEEITQELLHVSSDDKLRLLLGILKNEKPDSVIIFCNTKNMCEVLSKRLALNSIETEYIIGDLPQSKRLQVIDSFKRGSLRCLVATDVAARGIDVNDLAMVVNYDLPNEAENYVHRIGRTARAGKTGKAYSFCTEQDVYNLPSIEKYIEAKIPSALATEEMFAEDASKGIYIRLENHHEDENDRDSRHEKKNRHEKNSRGTGWHGRSSEQTIRTRGSSRYDKNSNASKPNQPKRDSYNRKKNSNFEHNRSREKFQDKKISFKENRSNVSRAKRFPTKEQMANLSFEERMAIYKKKYGQTTSEQTTTKKENPIKRFLKKLFGKKEK